MQFMLLIKKRSQCLDFKDALRVKSAELWLKLGQSGLAFSELQRLPKRLWHHPSVRMALRSVCRDH